MPAQQTRSVYRFDPCPRSGGSDAPRGAVGFRSVLKSVVPGGFGCWSWSGAMSRAGAAGVSGSGAGSRRGGAAIVRAGDGGSSEGRGFVGGAGAYRASYARRIDGRFSARAGGACVASIFDLTSCRENAPEMAWPRLWTQPFFTASRIRYTSFIVGIAAEAAGAARAPGPRAGP